MTYGYMCQSEVRPILLSIFNSEFAQQPRFCAYIAELLENREVYKALAITCESPDKLLDSLKCLESVSRSAIEIWTPNLPN